MWFDGDKINQKLSCKLSIESRCYLYVIDVGEVAHEEDEEDIPVNVQGPDVGVLVRLYAIHTKSVDCM